MIFKYILFCLLCIVPLCASQKYEDDEHFDKVYLDEDNIKNGKDAFYIHIGHNVWIHTNTVIKDGRGMYTYDYMIAKSVNGAKKLQYEKKWRCPYCYNYWPIGTPCQNEDCPSRYVI